MPTSFILSEIANILRTVRHKKIDFQYFLGNSYIQSHSFMLNNWQSTPMYRKMNLVQNYFSNTA